MLLRFYVPFYSISAKLFGNSLGEGYAIVQEGQEGGRSCNCVGRTIGVNLVAMAPGGLGNIIGCVGTVGI